MAIHTAQHLLSAVLDTYSLPTLSWSLTSHPSLEPPYIELSRKRGEGDVARVESVLEEVRYRARLNLWHWMLTSMLVPG